MSANEMTPFDNFFRGITGNLPHDYQRYLAGMPVQDCLIRVPTLQVHHLKAGLINHAAPFA